MQSQSSIEKPHETHALAGVGFSFLLPEFSTAKNQLIAALLL